MKKLEVVDFEKTHSNIFCFEEGEEVKEYLVMITVTDTTLLYEQQAEAIFDAYQAIRGNTLSGAEAVFKRYFLSDAANQEDFIFAEDYSSCAISVIQQPPLNGSKIALLVYMQTNMNISLGECGLHRSCHGTYRHIWGGSAHNMAANSEYQARLLLNEYIVQLAQENCKLSDNCIRTWFFVNDVDLNYGGVVRARNQVFFTQGLTQKTHFISSTGIGGRQKDTNVLAQMDTYAIDGISQEQIQYLYGATHLNRTSDYGVSFERGTAVQYGDRRHVFISGTASIDNKGQIVYPGDIRKQTGRMMENVEVLLKEGGCTYDDVAYMIVYLRDIADYNVVKNIYEEKFKDKPYIIVHAPVCRPGWLVEMECMAIKDIKDNRFEAL